MTRRIIYSNEDKQKGWVLLNGLSCALMLILQKISILHIILSFLAIVTIVNNSAGIIKYCYF